MNGISFDVYESAGKAFHPLGLTRNQWEKSWTGRHKSATWTQKFVLL